MVSGATVHKLRPPGEFSSRAGSPTRSLCGFDPDRDPWNAVRQGHEFEIGDPPRVAHLEDGIDLSIQGFHPRQYEGHPGMERIRSGLHGTNYSVRINGEVVTTWTDPDRRTGRGYIGLQNYNDGQTVRFLQSPHQDLLE